MKIQSHPLLLAAALVLLLATAGDASITVWLNYTDFDTRLDELASDAGITAFDSTEKAAIRSSIADQLATIYSFFDVTFTDAQPGSGDYHRLVMGATTSDTTLLGMAAQLDWRNLNLNDSADIYTRNFSFFIESGDTRAQMIAELSAGLAGSTAHELGHNLGLFHEDSYGDRGISAANYSNTGGLQNKHIMATGSTGLTEAQRELLRTFNTLETTKLEFGQGLTDHAPASLSEQGSAHGDYSTAQGLSFTSLPIAGVDALNLTGAISSSGQEDWYSFSGLRAQYLTVEVMSWALDRIADYIDPYIYLYDSDGTSLLWSNDDTSWDGNTFNSGTVRSYDSIFLNRELPHDGSYFLRVIAPYNSPYNTGNYELLTILDSYYVPEPATAGVFACGVLALMLRRRRRLAV